ncbi:hypothetical protein PK98_04335 [Croceibacterium mercuriale]|uniref:DUF2264 domain-containing protein n=1 Tax=Croceibacterium mercuriale TaxID=1572751 RepID=A0A0B2BW57_9SPHN|nr:DUF2264 domain-containing protein [Croceibacterium mercuriale]KHL25838.1 hypothetical protein PK98_04335 [Croceibacterium mercuriale]
MLDRRQVLGGAAGGAAMIGAAGVAAGAEINPPDAPLHAGAADRAFSLDLLQRMAQPVLDRMARGRLRQEWTPEVSPTWDGRNLGVSYLEAFGRLLDGIAPWLALPDDGSPEGRLRARLRDQALSSLDHAVDPASPDYLTWQGEGQVLVDSAYLTSALLRAPDALWQPLSATTKQRLVAEMKALRQIDPPYTNWLLFAAMNEAFLFSIGEDWDPMRVTLSIRKFLEWYVGDGWYGDGSRFHFDYYNSYVIQPMLVQILSALATLGSGKARLNGLNLAEQHELTIRRAQRYCEHLERMIGPDGAYPAIGRSLTYRTAVHQPLGQLAWLGKLPDSLPAGQVRAATMAAQRRIFADPSNFNADGFLTIGFARHQPALGDIYSNAGSMYVASESLLAMGLPASAAYWTDQPLPWTMRRAYGGGDFRKDYYVDY